MSYIEKHLLAGENVVYQTKLHWIVLIGHLLAGTLLLAGGIWLMVLASGQPPSAGRNAEFAGAGALMVIALILFLAGSIRRNATVMVVTNKRVLIKVGLASRRTMEMLFSKIESIAVDEPALGRLLGYGTVIVRGVGGTPEPFPNVAHPLEFRRQVQQQIENAEMRGGAENARSE